MGIVLETVVGWEDDLRCEEDVEKEKKVVEDKIKAIKVRMARG